VVGAASKVSQLKDFALRRRQCGECLSQWFSFLRGAGRYMMGLFDRHNPGSGAPSPKQIQGTVPNDGKPPALKRACAIIAVQPAISLQERLLDGVLRVGAIPNDGVRITCGLIQQRFYQLFELGAIEL
jgi:hypothetical protein